MCFLLFIIIDTAGKTQSSLLLLEQTSTPPRDFEQMLISLQTCMKEFEFPNFNAIEEGLLEDLVQVKPRGPRKIWWRNEASSYYHEFWFFWCPHFHPESRAGILVPCSYLVCDQHRSFNPPEDVSSHSHTEGPVDPFHSVRMARKIQQHLRVVKLRWIFLRVSKQPKEELSYTQFLTGEKTDWVW